MSTIDLDEPPDEPPERRSNQHLPAPPEKELSGYIKHYWSLGFHDEGIARQCMDHFDIEKYGLSKYTIQQRRRKLGLKGTRQQAATWGDILPMYLKLRAKFPNMGARAMVTKLRQDYGIKVPEALLSQGFRLAEPDQVLRHKRKRFRRKRFWSAGVMDKWKRFGLWLHVGVDPFAGRIAWLKIWWTNRNPKLITSYYIEACRALGGIPLVTQSDPGSENYGIANCHTITRQRLDPSLEGTLQHRWMNKKAMNVKPEALWSLMRRNFTPGFEDVLDYGINMGLFTLGNPLEKLVFRWLAVPWLQAELDAWVKGHNSSPRRSDKHKILPHGIPDLIVSKPERFGTKDYKVLVTPALFDEMETTWAPADDPVFELTPHSFNMQASAIFLHMGSPEVDRDNFWMIYTDLLDGFKTMALYTDPAFHNLLANADDYFEVPMELIPDQQELRNGANVVGGALGYDYFGGLAVPPAMDTIELDPEEDIDPREYAVFTDDEDGD
ncbi:hypothetical protein C8R43DRAFT_951294 [Mycena crocata]|nr:hypothetical protein C8R43DRAFT_951294 [Mycena crocata]